MGEIAGIGNCLSAVILCIIGMSVADANAWKLFAVAGVFGLLAIANGIVAAARVKHDGK